MGKLNRKSFTLIELIVAVGVISIILPPMFNIFFTMMRQQLVLVSYQEMKQQGDSVKANLNFLLQNRTMFITDSTYTATDICPILPLPTPTDSPRIYIKDRDGNGIKLDIQPLDASTNTIASFSANMGKTFNLTSTAVSISDLYFTCSRINEFTPATVTTKFTVLKSTLFKDVSLPYTFSVRLRDY